MGFRSWLLRPIVANTNGDWFVAFQDALEANKSHAGVSVTQETAVTLGSVYRCVSLNSDVVSCVPVGCERKAGNKRLDYPKPQWMESPNDDMDWGQFLGQMQASIELDGNAFALKASAPGGQLAGLYPLAPAAVMVGRDADGNKAYRVKKTDGSEEEYPAEAILHVPGFTLPGAMRGLSPIACAKQSIGLGLAAEQFGAQFFGTGATLSGVITVQGAAPQGDALTSLKEQFTRKHGGISKSHAIGLLSGGATWTPLSVKPEEAQFLETRRYTDIQIASLFGVPHEYVTDAEGAKGYVTGVYARQYMWLQTGINVRLTRWERALSALLPDKNAYVKFNRNAFLAMDPKERSEFYAAGLQGRWLTPNEIRGKEDHEPYVGGDDYLWSVQWGADPAKSQGENQ